MAPNNTYFYSHLKNFHVPRKQKKENKQKKKVRVKYGYRKTNVLHSSLKIKKRGIETNRENAKLK